MAQPAQPQPQEDPPRFFFRISDRRMQHTATAKARQITRVPIFAPIQFSMANRSFPVLIQIWLAAAEESLRAS